MLAPTTADTRGMKRQLAGAVLAGGGSVRFGRNKAETIYHGRPLLDWAAAAVGIHTSMVLVAGARHGSFVSVDDRPSPGLGPLGGIAGALAAASALEISHVMVVPCDMPHIPAPLLAMLASRVAASVVRSQPVIGIWPTSLAAPLEEYLKEGRPRAVRALADHIGADMIDWPSPIANINYMSDLAELDCRLG